MLCPSNYCVLGVMSTPPKLISVVSFKFASVVHIINNVQALEAELIHLDNLFMVPMNENKCNYILH